MPRGHKYIKKYRNSHGNWTYVYDLPKPEDIIRPWPPANKAPKMYDQSKQWDAWDNISSKDQTYRTPNGYQPDHEKKGPKISYYSTNSHDPRNSYERRIVNTNKLLSRTTVTRNEFSINGGLGKRRSVYELHEQGKLERAYSRGKRKATKLRRSLKRAGSKAISRGKQAVRNFLPHTEIKVHDAELH
jgi:hypothetical protein